MAMKPEPHDPRDPLFQIAPPLDFPSPDRGQEKKRIEIERTFRRIEVTQERLWSENEVIPTQI